MAEDAREHRRAFRTIIRMIRADRYLCKKLASFIKKTSEDVYDWSFAIPDTIVSMSEAVGLHIIPAWNYLLHSIPNNQGSKFAAEIAWEFLHRSPTNKKYEKWSTQEISEYVTRKIIRQQKATSPPVPWWPKEFLSHIFLGLGPWPVGDDADDVKTSQVSNGADPNDDGRSFGTGPWPKGDGTE